MEEEKEYVFYVSWERFPIDSNTYKGKISKIYNKIISSSQDSAWKIITKTFFKMVDYKPDKNDYLENRHRVWQDGSKENCYKVYNSFVSVEPESMSIIKNKF